MCNILLFINWFFSVQVMINGSLEKRIIDVINDHKKQNDDKGMISKRLTAKKLQVKFKAVFSDYCLFRINSFFYGIRIMHHTTFLHIAQASVACFTVVTLMFS